jgi:hypothetical protein
MPRRHSLVRRKSFVLALHEIDRFWAEVFPDEAYYDLNYSDLFTRMWLAGDRPLKKTDLYAFMPRVSLRTAVKYVQRAIDSGLLTETLDLADRRSKRVALSDDVARNIEGFIDHALTTFDSGPFEREEKSTVESATTA